MNRDRWKRIEDVYQAALERPPGERVAFIEAACSGDGELRREVDALLAHAPHANEESDVIERPVLVAAKRLSEDRSPSLVGRRLGPYQIEASLGAGGMGEVYRAHDSRLNRDVAVKVLPAAFAADADRLRRFEQEATMARPTSSPSCSTARR